MPAATFTQIDRRAEPAGLAEHHIAVAGTVARAGRRAGTVGRGAPMMRSSKPSPFTSPAEETEMPDVVVGIRPVDHEAADAQRNIHKVDRHGASSLTELLPAHHPRFISRR